MSTHINSLSAAQASIIDFDGYLEPYRHAIFERKHRYERTIASIAEHHTSLEQYSSWHKDMGFHWHDNHILYREWAPAAKQLFLTGDFNHWDHRSHPLVKKDHGIWEISLPAKEVPHLSQVKVCVESAIGIHDRLPSFTTYTKQDPETHSFNTVIWNPQKPFQWDSHSPLDAFAASTERLLIYEAHVGMAVEEHRVGTYTEFADNILPYIAELGYNCVQLMAIMEHPYYGSFGYHVSNLYAVSSRFGTPDDFKYLVNAAHRLGLIVIIDAIHSHAVKNFYEGLNQFDGSDHQFFRSGERGYHTLWDSKLYDYGKIEVQRYLLSNLRYWMEEYHVDGFRFDGITSMLYHHHGHYKDFVHYDMYFNDEVDLEALLYLQLATAVCHHVAPHALTIAEDMSGMPGLCRPTEEGGIGFDYRLAMGIPDYWIKIIKELKDEEWKISSIYHTLVDRRSQEKTIAYCESHDQSLVGDKTLAFRLMDQEMYWKMNKGSQSLIIDRGIALHKIIRLITCALGGEGYLNFMGNEFGHPEWVDFPREGNNFSYLYARRQWSLIKNDQLRYDQLLKFDTSMLTLFKKSDTMNVRLISIDEHNKIVVCEVGNLICVISFNPHESCVNYRIGVPEKGEYRIVLCSDDEVFGGFGRIDTEIMYGTQDVSMHGYAQSLEVYSTNRTGFILKKQPKDN